MVVTRRWPLVHLAMALLGGSLVVLGIASTAGDKTDSILLVLAGFAALLVSLTKIQQSVRRDTGRGNDDPHGLRLQAFISGLAFVLIGFAFITAGLAMDDGTMGIGAALVGVLSGVVLVAAGISILAEVRHSRNRRSG